MTQILGRLHAPDDLPDHYDTHGYSLHSRPGEDGILVRGGGTGGIE